MSTAAVEVTTPSDREVCVRRTFDAPRELVFRAWTEPGLLRRWLLGPPGWSMAVCDVDLRVGGAYRYEWRRENGETMGMGGTFRAIEPPARLVTTEVFDDDWTGGETTVTLDLTERAGATVATVTVLYASKDARDAALATGMTEGMAAGYIRLETVLAGLAG